MSNVKGLLSSHSNVDSTDLADVYWIHACVIERSLIESGAIPGKDYSILDLYQLAQPHVLRDCKSGDIKVVAELD